MTCQTSVMARTPANGDGIRPTAANSTAGTNGVGARGSYCYYGIVVTDRACPGQDVRQRISPPDAR